MKDILAHPEFLSHISGEREKIKDSCVKMISDEISNKIASAKFWVSLTLGVIVSLVVYIFNTSNESLRMANKSALELNKSVIELTVTIASIEKNLVRLDNENQKQQDGIEKLKDRLYTR